VNLTRLDVAERSVQPNIVVLCNHGVDALDRLEIVVTVSIAGFVAHGAVETLDDAVGFGMASARANVDRVVLLDHLSYVAVHVLGAMVCTMRGRTLPALLTPYTLAIVSCERNLEMSGSSNLEMSALGGGHEGAVDDEQQRAGPCRCDVAAGGASEPRGSR
jgi:hypothetical protein